MVAGRFVILAVALGAVMVACIVACGIIFAATGVAHGGCYSEGKGGYAKRRHHAAGKCHGFHKADMMQAGAVDRNWLSVTGLLRLHGGGLLTGKKQAKLYRLVSLG